METLVAGSDCLFCPPFFFKRPSHDSAVGMTDKAGQKFHRSSAYYQDDGQVTQQIVTGFVKWEAAHIEYYSSSYHTG